MCKMPTTLSSLQTCTNLEEPSHAYVSYVSSATLTSTFARNLTSCASWNASTSSSSWNDVSMCWQLRWVSGELLQPWVRGRGREGQGARFVGLRRGRRVKRLWRGLGPRRASRLLAGWLQLAWSIGFCQRLPWLWWTDVICRRAIQLWSYYSSISLRFYIITVLTMNHKLTSRWQYLFDHFYMIDIVLWFKIKLNKAWCTLATL